MLQAHQNTIQVIATALGVLSVFWGLLVVLFSLVDPIAPAENQGNGAIAK
jgi:hypothetical protein